MILSVLYLVKSKIYFKFMFASMKKLSLPYQFKKLLWISVPASLSAIGRFSPVSTPHWMREKST
jgi:hypothetical protein